MTEQIQDPQERFEDGLLDLEVEEAPESDNYRILTDFASEHWELFVTDDIQQTARRMQMLQDAGGFKDYEISIFETLCYSIRGQHE